MMSMDEFKKLFFQTGENSKVAALVGMSIGILGCIAFIVKDYSIYGVVAFAFLAVSGAYGYYLNLKQEAVMKSGHPLIKAMEAGNSDYIKWFYVTVLTHKRTIKAANFKTYYVDAYDEEKNVLDIGLDDEEQCKRMAALLSSKFPNAVQGFSEEIRLEMIAKYNYKGINDRYEPAGD